ncbi:MAG: hypothetical protein Q9184_004120 [Pyrenodesmia sp. 2 TL-2023]
MAERGGAISVVICGIDERKDIVDSIRDNGEEHCLSDSLPASDEDEKRREPDKTNRDTSIKPTDEHNPRETKEHASGEEQQDRLAAIFPSDRAVVDG